MQGHDEDDNDNLERFTLDNDTITNGCFSFTFVTSLSKLHMKMTRAFFVLRYSATLLLHFVSQDSISFLRFESVSSKNFWSVFQLLKHKYSRHYESTSENDFPKQPPNYLVIQKLHLVIIYIKSTLQLKKPCATTCQKLFLSAVLEGCYQETRAPVQSFNKWCYINRTNARIKKYFN